MTTKRIIYTNPDGSVSVIIPAAPFLPDETEADYLDRIWARAVESGSVPAGFTNKHICDRAALPARDEFRNAWRQSSASPPATDMVEARKIKTNLIRAERDKRLADEDVKFIRAQEAGNSAEIAAVATRKQALRDIPATIQGDLDAIADTAALGAYEPNWP